MDDFLDDSYGGLGYFQQLNDLYEEVEQEIDELREHEYRAADNEGTYRMLITTRTAALRMSNTPVTIVSSLVKGEPEVVQAFLAMEKAKADAKASQHLIFLRKEKMEMLTELIKHEWYRPSNA